MTDQLDHATRTARDYYNSEDADNFYAQVWGGEDIHIGLYRSAAEPIRDASRRTVDHLADRLGNLSPETTVLDIGSGYGGAARRLVDRFGCRVICLNLSEAENERNRSLNEAAGVADRIEVVDGRFEDIPLSGTSVDAVWSQDAILHSGNRKQVMVEVDRVMKSGARFAFTDPMQADDCPDGVLDPILARIHLPDLGSPGFYKESAVELGWHDKGYEDMTNQLVAHYSRVLETLNEEEPNLEGRVSKEYVSRMKTGLGHWIEGGKAGYLAWGVFLFEKP